MTMESITIICIAVMVFFSLLVMEYSRHFRKTKTEEATPMEPNKLKACPGCGNEISSAAETCPHCKCGEDITTCDVCGKEVSLKARACPHCGDPRLAGVARESENVFTKPLTAKTFGWVVVPVIAICVGFCRFYYGSPFGGIHFELKESFSYKDTVVNVDNLIGMPRIALAAAHPAVMRQLQEMGVLETEEQVKARIQKEISDSMEESEQELRESYPELYK